MKYKLVNKTKISNKTLHKIIKFVCPKYLTKFTVRANHYYPTYYGFAFKKGVTININKNIRLPRIFDAKEYQKYGYYNHCRVKNIKEVLVCLISHELRHLWQENITNQNFDKELLQIYNCPITNKVFNIGYKSEKDASLYSKRMLLKWRKQK